MSYYKNIILRKQVRVYSMTFGVLIIVISAFLASTHLNTQSSVPPGMLVEAGVINDQDEWVSELPVRLLIPAINLNAEVQHIGLAPDNSGEMDVPSNFTDVGWYQPGTRPGMRGSAVIAGHYNGKSIPKAVFYDLGKLKVGDEVIIMSAERIEDIFYVVRVETYDYDAPTEEVFLSDDGKARLNLITCGGKWLSEKNVFDKRTVVFTQSMTDVE